MTITYQQIAPFGKIVWTKGIFEATEQNQEFRKEVVSFLSRHINHDWGCLTSKDDAEMYCKNLDDVNLKFNGVMTLEVKHKCEVKE